MSKKMKKVKATKHVPPEEPLKGPEEYTGRPVHMRGQIRAFRLGDGLPDLTHLMQEIFDMTDVLLGRTDPPVDHGTLTLMETADAFFARASEITMLLQKGEREGTITKGSAHYKFRTGELRTFTEMAKRAADLGSRRLTDDALRYDKIKTGRESR